MKKIIIKRYELNYVIENDKILFNTNNHYNSEGISRPDDYETVIELGNTKNWIDKFHGNNYCKITLDNSDLKWMKEAYKIGANTGKLSNMFIDEFEFTCNKYKNVFPKGNWFVRTDTVSLKEGKYKCGPYDSFDKIIISMVTSRIGHDCFSDKDYECNIYLMNWLDIDSDKEFRIFVYNNEITAISCQHLYEVNGWLNSLKDDEIVLMVEKIIDYFNGCIKEKMMYMGSYVMDLALVGEEDEPYFIEPNSFGKYYASGSALFQWKIDEEVLCGLSGVLEFRYTGG